MFGRYFGSRFFGPRYFGHGSDPGPPPSRDMVAIRDAAARIKATNLFAKVFPFSPWDAEPVGSDIKRCAFVAIKNWAEVDDADSGQGVDIVRTVAFDVWLVVNEKSPEKRYEFLDLLGQAVSNAVSGQPLGGVVMPDFTTLKRGQYHMPAPPVLCLQMTGEFRYMVDDFGGHDTSTDDGFFG